MRVATGEQPTGEARPRRAEGWHRRRVLLALVALVALAPFVAASSDVSSAGATSPGSITALEAGVPSGAGAPASVNPSEIACPSSTWCVAVGTATTASGWTWPAAEVLASGTCTAAQLPLPSGAGSPAYATVHGAACTAVGTCYVVGV